MSTDSGYTVSSTRASRSSDTSRRVAAEGDLRESEGRYREILEATYEGIWRINPQLITDYANLSMAEMLGYTVDEMVGRHLSDFLDEDGMRVAQASTERQRAGAKERMKISFVRKDGTELCALISVNALFDQSGAHVGNLAMVSDLTDQRETEAHLRETETFLAGVTASMEEGLLTLDADGRIATVNRAAKRILGYDAAELIGNTPCAALGCMRDGGRTCLTDTCRLEAISSSVAPLRIDDEVFVCKTGHRLPVTLSAAPLGDERAGPAGHIVVFHDISERKEASDHAQRELEELSWIGRLRDALNEDRLVLAAQPIVSIATEDVSSLELLVRMRDHAGELVMPGSFLPAAERFGLIGDLDRWVISRAVRLAADSQAVNVNLSANSLGDPQLARFIEGVLREERADPKLITFEITETALTRHPKLASDFTTHMTALGCRFALDDFGTGYGAFMYLKTLPIDYLKIDVEFVHDLLRNEASQHLVTAIVQLARAFGQQTVAEGVEDGDTLERLRELDIGHAQGYYIGGPQILDLK